MTNTYIGKESINGNGLAICMVIDSDIATGDATVYNRETGACMTLTVKRSVACKSRREFSKFPVPRDEGRKKDMEREKTIICVRRGINGTKYCACDKNGNPIRGFDKLSDVRKHWQKEINWGYVELVRELNKFPDTKAINSTIKCLEKILTSNAKKADTKPLG